MSKMAYLNLQDSCIDNEQIEFAHQNLVKKL